MTPRGSPRVRIGVQKQQRAYDRGSVRFQLMEIEIPGLFNYGETLPADVVLALRVSRPDFRAGESRRSGRCASAHRGLVAPVSRRNAPAGAGEVLQTAGNLASDAGPRREQQDRENYGASRSGETLHLRNQDLIRRGICLDAAMRARVVGGRLSSAASIRRP